MMLYLLVTAVTIGLAYQIRQTENHNFRTKTLTRRQGFGTLCLLAIFCVLFLLSALRLEVGNDYGTYVDTIHEIYVGGYVVTEPLFNAIVKLLCLLSGGENYLLVFAVFGALTIALYLKVLYEQSENFPLAFFLFMTLGIYFRTFNTVRFYLALAITMYAYRFVLKKQYVKFVLLIGLTAFLHKSVLVVIPLYWIARQKWEKWQMACLGVLAIAVAFGRGLVMEVALRLYPSYVDTIYLEQGTGFLANAMSLGRCIVVLLAALLCYKNYIAGDEELEFYFRLNILAILLYTCASYLPLVGRIGYYLTTSHILLLPALVNRITEEKKRKWAMIVLIVLALLYFALFLKTGNQEGVRILPYKSWLFYEKDFLNAGEIF